LSPSPSPLPFIGDTSDDDVDALDVEWDAGFAGFWYFSVDNEALGTFQAQNLTLDPGFIYLADPGGAIPVITPAQLGLPVGFGVDIDAFEFVRAVNPFITGGAQDPEQPPCDREETGGSLAVIFSVDRDDPSTPITSFDESGGLDPTRIYISFLDGTNIPLTAPLESDVDAVAAWFRSLAEEPFADCNGNGVNDIDEIFVDPGLDGNGNFILDLCEGIAGPCSGADLAPPFGIISQADVTAFVNAFFAMDPAADLAPPFGVISQADVTAFVNLFFAGCPAR
ncbi:MAG: GC-type dockerin domain-anchored protein, partial [Planctomycetota bacterium]